MSESSSETQLRRSVTYSAFAILAIGFVVAVGLFFSSREAGEKVIEEKLVPAALITQSTINVPQVIFTDITESSGVYFEHANGATGKRLLPETMGGGVALFDFDLDDDLDLLFINSRFLDDTTLDSHNPPRSVLYENDGSANFIDVSATHLNLSTYGMAPAIGDVNGDRFPDLFVTSVGGNHLFINDHGRQFIDKTAQFGVGGDANAFSSCATFFDYDRDDDLDLFVCNYIGWSIEIDQAVDFRLTGVGRAYGPPTDFPGTTSWLYRNDGERFTDVTATSGIQVVQEQTDNPVGKALAVAAVDVNGDGWSDLIVANDTVRNFLFINQTDGTFEERGIEYGIAFDASGASTGAMGLDAARFANDERIAVAIGNFANEMSSFYVSEPGLGIFSDDAIVAGIGAQTRKVLTFGLFFFDADLDGRLDLFNVNGHIEPEISTVQASQAYAQKSQLFWNCGDNCTQVFRPIPTAGTALEHPSVGRGATYGDLDADGDLDIVMTNVGDKPRVLRNDLETGNQWLGVRLIYRGGNQHGIGSIVRLVSDKITQIRYITRTRSYLSQFDAVAQFGLGESTHIDSIDILWPDGTSEAFPITELNQLVTLKYGEGVDKT